MTSKNSRRPQPVRFRMLDKLKKQQAREAAASAAETDPPYLAELIAEVVAAHPGLTKEEAREMLLASGA
jgi:hypothetical protein